MSRISESLDPRPYQPYNGDGTPGYKVGGTSREAAMTVADGVEEVREKILALLPGTAQEVADKLGRKRLFIAPRLSELVAEGKAMKSSRRKRNPDTNLTATVYERVT